MVDVVPTHVRSRMMSGIRSKGTAPEITVRKHLHGKGYRYRLSPKGMLGRPDLVLKKWKVAIFVNGCFWHGHDGCKYFKVPSTRPEFWGPKIHSNKLRDARARSELLSQSWRVAVIWECSLKNGATKALQELEAFVRSDMDSVSI